MYGLPNPQLPHLHPIPSFPNISTNWEIEMGTTLLVVTAHNMGAIQCYKASYLQVAWHEPNKQYCDCHLGLELERKKNRENNCLKSMAMVIEGFVITIQSTRRGFWTFVGCNQEWSCSLLFKPSHVLSSVELPSETYGKSPMNPLR